MTNFPKRAIDKTVIVPSLFILYVDILFQTIYQLLKCSRKVILLSRKLFLFGKSALSVKKNVTFAFVLEYPLTMRSEFVH